MSQCLGMTLKCPWLGRSILEVTWEHFGVRSQSPRALLESRAMRRQELGFPGPLGSWNGKKGRCKLQDFWPEAMQILWCESRKDGSITAFQTSSRKALRHNSATLWQKSYFLMKLCVRMLSRSANKCLSFPQTFKLFAQRDHRDWNLSSCSKI